MRRAWPDVPTLTRLVKTNQTNSEGGAGPFVNSISVLSTAQRRNRA